MICIFTHLHPFNGPHLSAPQSDIFVSLQVSYDIGVNILAFIPTVILGIIGGLLGAVFTFIYLKVQYVCMIMIGCRERCIPFSFCKCTIFWV